MRRSSDWEHLQRDLPGTAAPTATTLLAALWPDDHLIVGRRDLKTALAKPRVS